jgi:hypothetical protein
MKIEKGGLKMELGSVVFGAKLKTGELVLFEDKFVVYIANIGLKNMILQPDNLRAKELLVIPFENIRHITYEPGVLLLKYPRISLFLTPECYKECFEKLKDNAGVKKFLVSLFENKEYKLVYSVPRVPKEMAQRFVEKVLEVKEKNEKEGK